MRDIIIRDENINFKYRVNGIIIKDNKILTVQINNNGFYCLPGGHVALGESSDEAVLREIKEETNFRTKINKVVAIAENFFEGKNSSKYHEISIYYLLDLAEDIEIKDYNTIENDGEMQIPLEFKWYLLDNIKKENFKPEFLKHKLEIKDFSFVHKIIGK